MLPTVSQQELSKLARSNLLQVSCYLIFAGLGALADLLLFLYLSGVMGIVLASAIGIFFGSVINYLGNSIVTFRHQISIQTALRFFLSVTLVVSLGSLVTEFVAKLAESAWIGKLSSMIVVAVFQFIMHSKWTFRGSHNKKTD